MDNAKISPTQNKISLILLFFSLFVCAFWAPNSREIFVFPCFLAAILAFLPAAFGKSGPTVFEKRIALCALYTAAVCVVQYFNCYAEFEIADGYFLLNNLPHIAFLPKSVKTPAESVNALASLCKLTTVFLTVLSLYCICKRRGNSLYVLNFAAFCGVLCAAYGIIEKYFAFDWLYGIFAATSDFYANSFVANVSGAFINLGLGFCFCLLIYHAKRRHIFCSILFLLASAVCVFGAYKSESFGAMGFAALNCAAFVIIALYVFLRRAMNMAAATFIVAMCGLGAAFLGYNEVAHRLSGEGAKPKRMQLSGSFSSRLQFHKLDIALICENPLWGVGGECCKYALPVKAKKELLNVGGAKISVPERAHSDILEYFIEFGFLGLLGIFGGWLAYAILLFGNLKNLKAENYMLLASAGLCAMHCSVDMAMHFLPVMVFFAVALMLAATSLSRGGKNA